MSKSPQGSRSLLAQRSLQAFENPSMHPKEGSAHVPPPNGKLTSILNKRLAPLFLWFCFYLFESGETGRGRGGRWEEVDTAQTHSRARLELRNRPEMEAYVRLVGQVCWNQFHKKALLTTEADPKAPLSVWDAIQSGNRAHQPRHVEVSGWRRRKPVPDWVSAKLALQ